MADRDQLDQPDEDFVQVDATNGCYDTSFQAQTFQAQTGSAQTTANSQRWPTAISQATSFLNESYADPSLSPLQTGPPLLEPSISYPSCSPVSNASAESFDLYDGSPEQQLRDDVDVSVRRALVRQEEGIRIGDEYPGVDAPPYQFNRLQSFASLQDEANKKSTSNALSPQEPEIRPGRPGLLRGFSILEKNFITEDELVNELSSREEQSCNLDVSARDSTTCDTNLIGDANVLPTTGSSLANSAQHVCCPADEAHHTTHTRRNLIRRTPSQPSTPDITTASNPTISDSSRREANEFVPSSSKRSSSSSVGPPRRRSEEERKRRSTAELNAFVFSSARNVYVERPLRVVRASRQAFVRSFAVGLAGGSVLAIVVRLALEVYMRLFRIRSVT
jgi:hypothetical protein